MKSLQLANDQLQLILNSIRTFFPDVEIIFFGSRVRGEAKPYSDLDVALHGQQKLDPLQLMKLQDMLAESQLPIKVDILDLQMVSDSFRKHIEQTGTKVPRNH